MRLLFVISLMYAGLAVAQSYAAVTPYPPYPGATPSSMFTVTVDDQPAFVHNFYTFNRPSEPALGYNDYAHFAMTGRRGE